MGNCWCGTTEDPTAPQGIAPRAPDGAGGASDAAPPAYPEQGHGGGLGTEGSDESDGGSTEASKSHGTGSACPELEFDGEESEESEEEIEDKRRARLRSAVWEYEDAAARRGGHLHPLPGAGPYASDSDADITCPGDESGGYVVDDPDKDGCGKGERASEGGPAAVASWAEAEPRGSAHEKVNKPRFRTAKKKAMEAKMERPKGEKPKGEKPKGAKHKPNSNKKNVPGPEHRDNFLRGRPGLQRQQPDRWR
eukprot:TRINITY_DN27834_c0_g1_i1.p1 TRINITY_DN27834_c0_g1~~TRINITY_DN27834_c0_g1_i1.p1  ORF type:complete len:251 (+),score=63.50 TRINITY_DN27834_c0_g1_i1:97-849(+)